MSQYTNINPKVLDTSNIVDENHHINDYKELITNQMKLKDLIIKKKLYKRMKL